MSRTPSYSEQSLLADTMGLADKRLGRRERWSAVGLSVAFFAVAGALCAIDPPRAISPLPAVSCLVVLGLATRVRFDTPYGFTVATQLAFVPLLFAMPVTIVPAGVVVVMVCARLPDLLHRQRVPARLIKEIVNSWYVIGPVAVFAIAHRSPRSAGAALLIGALLAQFAIDFAVSCLRFRLERGASIASQLGETWVYAVDAALSVIALLVAEDIHRHPLVAFAPLPLLALLAGFARERRDRIQGLIELNAAYQGTALVLGDVVEADDGYTGEHCRSVVTLAMAVADQLGLSEERRRNLEFAALLHDVGKITIPKAIINKPGKLDADEWALMTTHTVEGQKMLDRIGGFMTEVGLIVRSHHERWDGRGYPDGLYAEVIPLEARIIACCDSWHAMRTDRSYRKALSHEVALTEMRANAGSQFDPRILDAFLVLVAEERDEAQALRNPTPLAARAA